ncbi:MAG: enoyl-CoA hydratase-related protein [Asticcacaulis sp.]
MSDNISVDLRNGVLHLRLDRATKKNALNMGLYDALSAHLLRATEDTDVHVVLISGEGPDFCAGNDMADFPAMAAHKGPPEEQPVFRFLKNLTFFPKPLVAAVQGQAVGIGTTLLLHCDQVWLGQGARLSLPFVRLGLVPEAGSSLLLQQRLGHVRAFDWLTSGRAIDAQTALNWGLVNGVLADEELMGAAQTSAEALGQLSPQAVAHTKALMRNPDQIWQHILKEGAIFRQRLTSPEALAAFAAFGKRG